MRGDRTTQDPQKTSDSYQQPSGNNHKVHMRQHLDSQENAGDFGRVPYSR